MNHKKYNIRDLIVDESFQHWVLFGTGEVSEIWVSYMAKNPDEIISISHARKIITSIAQKVLIFSDGIFEDFSEEQKVVFEQLLAAELKRSDYFSNEEIDTQINKLKETLDFISAKEHKVIPFYSASWLKVAAVILLAIGFGTIIFINRRIQKLDNAIITINPNRIIKRTNDSDKPLLITIYDGSSILLQAHSSISYPEKFTSKKREVNLSGEAFFEIAKEKSRPFYVYANGLTTKVTGTSFTVRAFEQDKQVQITVKTGKVTVYANESKQLSSTGSFADSVNLLPDQQALFGSESASISVSNIQKAELKEFVIQQQMFEFKETPIPIVFRELERSYGVKIISEEETINTNKITAFLCDKPYNKKLELICKMINGKYVQNDSIVTITSNKL